METHQISSLAAGKGNEIMMCVIPGNPVPKPRQTYVDRWQKRPCVLRYRAWCDLARLALKRVTKLRLDKPTMLSVRVYIQGPERKHYVGPHTQVPDSDNILKAVCDALFENDQMIYDLRIRKLWADGGQPRVEVEWW